MKLQQLQFPGTEGPTTSTPAVRGSSRAVDKLTEVAIERFPSEPAVGLRGSISDRVALGDRLERRNQNRARWQGHRVRNEDHDAGDTLNTQTAVGFGADPRVPYDVVGPQEIGAKAVWRKHAKPGWVATPLLHAGQEDVTVRRVNEIIHHPETTQDPRFPGTRELPQVFHDRMHDRDTIVEGHHRLTADLLQGKLFSEAMVMDSSAVPAARETRLEVARKVVAHSKTMDREKTQHVAERLNDNYYGRGNW